MEGRCIRCGFVGQADCPFLSGPMLVHGVLAVVFAGPRPSFASAGAKRRKVVGSMMLSRVASGRHDHLRAPGLGREAWRSAWRPTRLVFRAKRKPSSTPPGGAISGLVLRAARFSAG